MIVTTSLFRRLSHVGAEEEYRSRLPWTLVAVSKASCRSHPKTKRWKVITQCVSRRFLGGFRLESGDRPNIWQFCHKVIFGNFATKWLLAGQEPANCPYNSADEKGFYREGLSCDCNLAKAKQVQWKAGRARGFRGIWHKWVSILI